MKNKITIRFISRAIKCLVMVLFTFIICRAVPSSFKETQHTTVSLKPITQPIDQALNSDYELAPGLYILLPHTTVYECLNQHVPKRIFKYKLPTQTLKVLYKKNRVAVLYNKPINLTRKQVDLPYGNKTFDLVPRKKIWQLLRQNEALIPPFLISRMQRGDFSHSDDPLAKGLLS
ncbi:hypothetical protein AQ505_10270 [Pedobacter sp. PACM 27299]|uniref:hypothetical protein n=1 Tax=Pedobacter sp. PACM 27299 TaxID=1727164 RepID=UPI000706BC24|nr:hypothetical protein [Pedobacter sp. PACM 27299]ALL05845.1 hypothetical protein AQ505_10270 [Pedobacter sp. PACM 27299]